MPFAVQDTPHVQHPPTLSYDNRTADELEAHNTRGRNDWAAKLVAARASAVEQA